MSLQRVVGKKAPGYYVGTGFFSHFQKETIEKENLAMLNRLKGYSESLIKHLGLTQQRSGNEEPFYFSDSSILYKEKEDSIKEEKEDLCIYYCVHWISLSLSEEKEKLKNDIDAFKKKRIITVAIFAGQFERDLQYVQQFKEHLEAMKEETTEEETMEEEIKTEVETFNFKGEKQLSNNINYVFIPWNAKHAHLLTGIAGILTPIEQHLKTRTKRVIFLVLINCPEDLKLPLGKSGYDPLDYKFLKKYFKQNRLVYFTDPDPQNASKQDDQNENFQNEDQHQHEIMGEDN